MTFENYRDTMKHFKSKFVLWKISQIHGLKDNAYMILEPKQGPKNQVTLGILTPSKKLIEEEELDPETKYLFIFEQFKGDDIEGEIISAGKYFTTATKTDVLTRLFKSYELINCTDGNCKP